MSPSCLFLVSFPVSYHFIFSGLLSNLLSHSSLIIFSTFQILSHLVSLFLTCLISFSHFHISSLSHLVALVMSSLVSLLFFQVHLFSFSVSCFCGILSCLSLVTFHFISFHLISSLLISSHYFLFSHLILSHHFSHLITSFFILLLFLTSSSCLGLFCHSCSFLSPLFLLCSFSSRLLWLLISFKFSHLFSFQLVFLISPVFTSHLLFLLLFSCLHLVCGHLFQSYIQQFSSLVSFHDFSLVFSQCFVVF